MAFSHVETTDVAWAATTASISLSSPATAGQLLVGYALRYDEDLTSALTQTAGFSLAGDFEVSDRHVAIYYKEAVGGEDTFSVTCSNTGEEVAVILALYDKARPIDAVASDAGSTTNNASVSTPAVATESGALLVAFFRAAGESLSTNGFTLRAPAIGRPVINLEIWPADKIATSTSESATHTLTGSTLRNTALLVSFTETEVPAGPSISAADDITSEGDTAEFTLSGNSAAPVSATLNGTDVGTLTLVSGSTYSYTAPLIADDDTADLIVTVDSTTASAVISYANSYPYELVTHGEPDANSAFFDTAFATDGPVEWGVVTDFDSGVVVVDWAAMDAAEDELNDIALHSTEVAAGESTATLKYFVPESGATGTFQATATVDGTDETAPTISSASVPTAGNNIAVQMSESMQVGAGGSGGWTISLGGATITSAAVDGSDDTIINLTPSRTLTDEDTFTIGYTQPGNGFQDQADTPNDLATLSGRAVTNNSTQEPPDVTTPTPSPGGSDIAGIRRPLRGKLGRQSLRIKL